MGLFRWPVTVVILLLCSAGAVGTVAAQDTGGCLYVWTNDGDGEEIYATVAVEGIDSDYFELYETDESGDSDACGPVSDNGVPFQTPGGDFYVYVLDEGQPDEYWGVRRVSLSSSEAEYVSYDRGGVYQTDGTFASPRGTTRFQPGESAALDARLYNGQPSGSNEVTAEVYVYPEGESRPDRPTETLGSIRVSAQRHDSLSGAVTMPSEEGTYEVDVLYETTYDLTSPYTQLSDHVDYGTVTVEPFEPPRIADRTPDDATILLDPDATRTFEVAATDPDSTPAVTWYLDDRQVGSGSAFQYEADGTAPGSTTSASS